MTDSQTAADDGTKKPFWRRILGQPALHSGPVWIAASLFYYSSAFTHPAGPVRWTLLLFGLIVGSSLLALALLDDRHKRGRYGDR
jgi:hypothetical protein